MRQEIIVEVHRQKAGYWTADLKDLNGSVAHGRSLSRVRDKLHESVQRSGRNPTHIKVTEAVHLGPQLDLAVAEIVRRRDIEHVDWSPCSEQLLELAD